MIVGIPVLNRADLLDRALSRIDRCVDLVIVDNGNTEAVAVVAAKFGALYLPQESNLGVAGSWNLLTDFAVAKGEDRIIISSNDLMLSPGSIRSACETLPDRLWHVAGWNCFVLPIWVFEQVGRFDENFWPAYAEDMDYCYRCVLAGVFRHRVPDAGGRHLGGQTIASDVSVRKQCKPAIRRRYYRKKWGGWVGRETYRVPNFPEASDHRYWPPTPRGRHDEASLPPFARDAAFER